MDTTDYLTITRSIVDATDHVLTTAGAVLPPTLIVARGGEILGSATLRPVRRSQDAALAIVELSGLAAAAAATDVVLAWEEHDLHAALDAPAPDLPRTVTTCWSTPTSNLLSRYPFRIRPGNDGALLAVDWDTPQHDLPDPQVHPIVITTLGYCWQPLPGTLHDTARLMTSLGYQVDLTSPAPSDRFEEVVESAW